MDCLDGSFHPKQFFDALRIEMNNTVYVFLESNSKSQVVSN